MSRIDFLGHATTVIEVDGTRLLTDPLLRPRVRGLVHRHAHGARPPTEQRRAVLISHLHHDHLDLPSLKILGEETRVVVPRHGAALLRQSGSPQYARSGAGGPLRDQRSAAANDTCGPPRSARATWSVGRLCGLRHRVRHTGCTSRATRKPFRNALLGPIDVALMPIAGWGPVLGPGHMGPSAAVEALRLIRPHGS